MSQVTEQSVRFQTALASIKLIQASAVLDLAKDDFEFLTSNKVWMATDGYRSRRCVGQSLAARSRAAGSCERGRHPRRRIGPERADERRDVRKPLGRVFAHRAGHGVRNAARGVVAR